MIMSKHYHTGSIIVHFVQLADEYPSSELYVRACACVCVWV